jgi:pheromone shutdown protein TraB
VDNEYKDDFLEETPLGELLVTERDECIVDNLTKFYHEHKSVEKTTYVAVIFGAKHMIAINRCLRDLGFRARTKKWFELIRPEACEI